MGGGYLRGLGVWNACGMSVFSNQHQAGPSGEHEIHRTGKEAWDPGKGTGQTKGPDWYSGNPRICVCLGI